MKLLSTKNGMKICLDIIRQRLGLKSAAAAAVTRSNENDEKKPTANCMSESISETSQKKS